MSAFIGRSHELNALDAALTSTVRGDGALLVVSGAAGIGKSRLIRETQRRALARGFALVEGSCEESDRDVVFAGVLRLLRARLRQCGPEVFVQEAGAAAGQIARVLPELRHSIDVEKTEGGATAIYEGVASWLRSVAKEQPLLLSLEDLHWCDEVSIACLIVCWQQLQGTPALLLLSVRNPQLGGDPEGAVERLFEQHGGRHLRLQPLSRPEVAKVMSSISGASSAPPFYFLKQVFDMTGGNPLFVEELCLSSPATDTVSGETDLLGLHPRPQTIIPRSIRRIIRQRVQAVSMEAQLVAGLAAAHGRQFDRDLLQALMGYSAAQLQQRCSELVAAHLAIEAAPGQFWFRHALIGEAIYARLLVRERRAMHERLAAGLEKVYADSLEEHLAALSYHSYKAACWKRTLHYCRQAACKASAAGATRTAVTQLSRAIEAATWLRNEPVWRLLCERATALQQLGDWDRALTDYVTALDSARGLNDRDIEVMVVQELERLLPVLPQAVATHSYNQMVARIRGENSAEAGAPV